MEIDFEVIKEMCLTQSAREFRDKVVQYSLMLEPIVQWVMPLADPYPAISGPAYDAFLFSHDYPMEDNSG